MVCAIIIPSLLIGLVVAVFKPQPQSMNKPQLLASFDRNFVGVNVVCSLDDADDDGVL